MFHLFYPHEYTESVFSIDYQKLYDKGYRAILFDIDNTLVPHGKDSTPEVDELFRNLHRIGFKTIVVSNNSEARILRFLRNIDSPYVYDAQKPKPGGYRKALSMLEVPKEAAVVIGDQVFTDILGANLAGIPSILVEFIRRNDETKIGIRRNVEKLILKCYARTPSRQHRLGDIHRKQVTPMPQKQKKLFCEMNPLFYQISVQKGICKRHLRNLLSKEKFAATRQEETLPNLVASYNCGLIKKGPGIDPKLQENKAVNIALACGKLQGLIIHPGETFSFWGSVGKTTRRRGFREGRVIQGNRLVSGTGGGLCNLGNTIHYMILHSPLTVTEFHQHSDALAPDEGGRKPFSAGTSVSYNYIDYRFRNDTDQNVQLLLWCENERLYGELRSEKSFPWTYELVEEGHHFRQEGEKFYRVSKIYRQIRDRESGEPTGKELVLHNHSEVMYDYALIPKDQIRQPLEV